MVTLSRNALRSAVIPERRSRIAIGSPRATRTVRTASQPKTPVRRRTPAMIIIPKRRKMTFQSTAWKPASWVTIPRRMTATAPSRAASVRSMRSEAIAPYVTTKIARATQGSIWRRQPPAAAAASSSPSI